jgi:hypothetical protein
MTSRAFTTVMVARNLSEMTRLGTEYNAEYVNSKEFWNTCERTNESVYQLLKSL